MEGWISLHRKIMSHPEYFTEKFTRMGAWIDLLLLANHKNGYIRKRGIKTEVTRGQTAVSRDTLAKRWKWSPGKVTRFLDELEAEGQIIQQKNNVTNCITICKYDEYQRNDTANQPPQPPTNNTPNSQTNEPQTIPQTETNNNVINNNNAVNENKDTHTNNFDYKIFSRARDFLSWVEKDYPDIQSMPEPFTQEQAMSLLKKYPEEDIARIVIAMYNKGATKNKNAYATFCSYAATDHLLKEKREKQSRIYSFNEMTIMLTKGEARKEDFQTIEKDGTRYFILKTDQISNQV